MANKRSFLSRIAGFLFATLSAATIQGVSAEVQQDKAIIKIKEIIKSVQAVRPPVQIKRARRLSLLIRRTPVEDIDVASIMHDLIGLLKTDDRVSAFIAEALQHLGPHVRVTLPEIEADLHARECSGIDLARLALKSIGTAPVKQDCVAEIEALIEGIKSMEVGKSDRWRLANRVATLVRDDNPKNISDRVIGDLIEFLGDDTLDLSAAVALGDIGLRADRAIPALQNALDEINCSEGGMGPSIADQKRQTYRKALEKIGAEVPKPDCMARIRALVSEIKAATADEVKKGLGERLSYLVEQEDQNNIDDKLLDDLINFLEDESVDFYVAGVLGTLGKRANRAIPALEKHFRKHECDMGSLTSADTSFAALVKLGAKPAITKRCSRYWITPRECLVSFRLDRSEIKPNQRALADLNRPRGLSWTEPLEHIDSDGDVLQLHFKKDCDKKDQVVEQLLAYWRVDPLNPKLERFEEPIQPDPFADFAPE